LFLLLFLSMTTDFQFGQFHCSCFSKDETTNWLLE
jgi:hypothetical protein